jgi:hypothetical protein
MEIIINLELPMVEGDHDHNYRSPRLISTYTKLLLSVGTVPIFLKVNDFVHSTAGYPRTKQT